MLFQKQLQSAPTIKIAKKKFDHLSLEIKNILPLYGWNHLYHRHGIVTKAMLTTIDCSNSAWLVRGETLITTLQA